MKEVILRDEEPPDDTVVVVRGGEMNSAFVRRTAQRSAEESGYYAVSVFLALDEPVELLGASEPYVARYGQVRLTTVGRIRHAGFPMLPTLHRPHYDVVLPTSKNRRSSGSRPLSTGPSPIRPGSRDEAAARALRWSGYEVGSVGRLSPHRRRPSHAHQPPRRQSGIVLRVGDYVVVGNEEADPAVAEVVSIDARGIVLVRVLPGPAEEHLHLTSRIDRAG